MRPVRVSEPALELFSNHLLEHVLVKREIGDQLLELTVFLFQLAEAMQLRYAHASEALLPAVEGLFTDTQIGVKRSAPRFLALTIMTWFPYSLTVWYSLASGRPRYFTTAAINSSKEMCVGSV